MKHLIIDGMNFFHRARAGFQAGPHPLMFNFFRNLRAIIALHEPDKVYYVLEGHPEHRHKLHPEYKANRIIKEHDDGFESKFDELSRLFEGHNDVLELMAKCFPITIIRHPLFECDDVIAHLVSELGPEDEAIIISSDTDFIQLLQQHRNVKLYNAVKKTFIEPPKYNYLTWKCLRGDSSDNIPGIKGCGDKTAEKIVIGCLEDDSLNQLT